MSVKHKISGFFSAVLIAIISFFVFYFFIPEYSDKYLGISFKSDRNTQKIVKEKTDEITEIVADSAKDRLKDLFN